MSTRRSRFRAWRVATAAALICVAASLLYSAGAPADDWKAPERAAKKHNPIPSDAATIAAGKTLFTTNCVACHGSGGKGDGPAAAACNPRPKDLSDPAIVSQSDGALFWKVTEGKKPMPTYEKLLSETERWKVIVYIRTFAPKGGK